MPPAIAGLGLMIYELAVLVEAAYPGSATWITASWGTFLARAFASDALPTRLPQIVTAVLAVVIVAVLAAALRARTAPAGAAESTGRQLVDAPRHAVLERRHGTLLHHRPVGSAARRRQRPPAARVPT